MGKFSLHEKIVS